MTLSDCILQEARWKTQEAKNKTIEQVLTKHNFLHSAYTVLLEQEVTPLEKYYPFIRSMATRPCFISPDGYEMAFDDIENALYGLAKYRKKEDIKIIKEQLLKHEWKMGYTSFRLMKEFPDTAYLDIFEDYYRREFYRLSKSYYRYPNNPANYGAFIDALAMYQDERSSNILDSIIHRLPRMQSANDIEKIQFALVSAVWEHPCPAYARLREELKSKAKEYLRGTIDVDRYKEVADTTKEHVGW